ncbi:MAG: hypothetical protein HN704_01960 [Bacteroidetes bacterium]|jgi:hypothetical protein|nr:hypothetical protein [Bacteroidota bacterium]MBT6685338.1 hypothetical protein [Bacteroidota bacterium]MBT7490350.1 hypothetical protein [Bacteroidota bacterium]
MKQTITNEAGQDVFDYLSKFTKVVDKEILVVYTSSVFNIENQEFNKYKNIINLRQINDIIRINKFFEAVNVKIPNEGVFIGHVETKNQRRERYFRKFPTEGTL